MLGILPDPESENKRTKQPDPIRKFYLLFCCLLFPKQWFSLTNHISTHRKKKKESPLHFGGMNESWPVGDLPAVPFRNFI